MEPFVDKMVAVPDELVAGEAEEVSDDASAGRGDVDLWRDRPVRWWGIFGSNIQYKNRFGKSR
jgi:hypothetical protein